MRIWTVNLGALFILDRKFAEDRVIIFTVRTLASALSVSVTKLTELITPFWVLIGAFGTL